MSSGNEGLRVEKDGGIAIITLNEPQKRNAITRPMAKDIAACFDTLDADPEVKAVVITGAPPAFSAGGDFADLIAAREGDPGRLREIYAGFLRVLNSPLPTIAAVNGPAVGAGLNLALACDIRIAGTSAKFDARFLSLGLHPGGGHTWMLTQAIGTSQAMAMLLFGEALDGPAAERTGLAVKCVGDAELLGTAIAFAKRATAHPRDLLQNVKGTLRMAATSPFADVLEREYKLQAQSVMQPAFEQAMAKVAAAAAGKKG